MSGKKLSLDHNDHPSDRLSDIVAESLDDAMEDEASESADGARALWEISSRGILQMGESG